MALQNKAELEKFRQSWSKIVARAWSDAQFKQKLLTKTGEALKEYGLSIHPGMNLKILEETEQSGYLILPKKPAAELSEEEMRNMAAAGFTSVIIMINHDLR